MLLTTVTNNKAQFSRRKIEGADKARALYRKIGRPSQQQLEQILAKNLIRNCPVTVDDAKRALLIYGPNVAALKGKITKGPSQHVPTFNPVQVLGFILQHHSDVTLCMDIFYVQGHPFFTPSLAKFNSALLPRYSTGTKQSFSVRSSRL